ncbi:hypothetical protein J6590_085334 [Homalodisca vitripennis]|nr:hypothetical protein J6590_085334 [Homalodisca vitripennis]
MHKVTEDTEALRQLLTSVSSALQKNRVVANKLKTDTTKCLSLCEMAQRTHDTPPGLQNDNIAPLEFFIQLVSKFERDIQVLRQEIDNTEKHVNSLSYPAILTPQELSVALRRLHDSFVALAGRLQAAHAGVIAQKERHLSLRRHFLKDQTNIFETTTRTASAAKKSPCGAGNFPPMPGPTPFSSIQKMAAIAFNPSRYVTKSTNGDKAFCLVPTVERNIDLRKNQSKTENVDKVLHVGSALNQCQIQHTEHRKKAVRTLIGLNKLTFQSAIQELKILTVTLLHIFEVVKQGVDKNHQRLDTHNYSTRNNANFAMPTHHTSLYKKELCYAGTRLFNLLPEQLKKYVDKTFNKHHMEWLLEPTFYTLEEFVNRILTSYTL